MIWIKQARGPYICYTVDRDFTMAQVLEQTKVIHEDLKQQERDVALDLRKLKNIDGPGARFIVNLSDTLERMGRRMVFVGGTDEIMKLLTEKRPVKTYATLADFELEFHEMNPHFVESILQLAQGGVGFKGLTLICPLCHDEDVQGFVLDQSKYTHSWSEKEITPIWIPAADGVETVDFSMYQVSVCPECFFASTRPDHFTIAFPEGEIKSRLRPDQVNNLKMSNAGRKQLASQTRDSEHRDFLQPPRDTEAAYMSWQLHEFCQKQLYLDRKMVDAYELVVANFYMCKYSTTERMINDHMHTALAWLNNLMQNRAQYSTSRLVRAYTFQISVLLALDKPNEAKKAWEEFRREFGQEAENAFWIKRAESLIIENFGEA